MAEADDLHAKFVAAREPVPKSYPARSRAWREYRAASCVDWIPRDDEIAKAAFIAGWEARKRAQYNGGVS